MNPRGLLAVAILSCCALVAVAAGRTPTGSSVFTFTGWAGANLEVRLFVPERMTGDTPVVIVMHGASRDAPRYFDNWSRAAEEQGFIVAVPHFTKADFRGSRRYNLGHVFSSDDGERRAEGRWTFSAIEPLFDEVVARTGTRRTGYTLFGHSAGSQFVHRFLYFKADNRVERAILANAGWYTMPDPGVDFPYGIRDTGIDEQDLRRVFAIDVIVLLGDSDVDTKDDTLRQTPEAQLQGPHRFARGQTFYRVAQARARSLDAEFTWHMVFVPGAAHSNAAMTPAAAELVE
jgi:hypothetical protein